MPISEPDLTGDEREYLLNAFDSGWISSLGEHVQKFESEWATACGSKYSLAVSNGTVALHLALAALEIGPGDEVIVPSLTYIASVNAIKYVGATPVFCDVDLDTWCITVENIQKLITPRTKAIIGVHLYGNPTGAMDIRTLCESRGLYFVEDAAEAPFASIAGKTTGNIGHIATFSFFGNKIITCGEGGVVTTSDELLYKRMKLLRDQGMDPDRRYYFPVIGFNFRLTNLQAAILRAQMKRIDFILEHRFLVYSKYNQILADLPNVVLQKSAQDSVISPWLYTILLNIDRPNATSELMGILALEGIETRPIFLPVHTMPPYKDVTVANMDNTAYISSRGISLPTSSLLTIESVEHIATLVKDWLYKNR